MKKFKLIALFLALLFIFYAIPMNIYAEFQQEDVPQSEEASKETTGFSYQYDDSTREILNLRNANTKHYRTVEGNFVAYHYAKAVHLQNEDGEWEDINNTLAPTLFGTYKNEDSRIRFAKKVGSLAGLFVLQDEGTKITWNLQDGNKGTEAVVNNGNENNSLQKPWELSEFTSTVAYNNAVQSTDLVYTAAGLDLMQTLIIHEAVLEYSVSFELKLNDLVAVATAEGDIELQKKDGEVLYTIVAPVAYDAKGVPSNEGDVTLSLEQKNAKKYTLTISVAQDYLCDTQRAFPVNVSANLTRNQPQSTLYTAYAKEANGLLRLTNRTLVDENTVIARESTALPTLPEDAVITKAMLNVSEKDVGANVDGVALYYMPSGEDEVLSEENMLGVSYREDGYSWDVTSLLKENPDEEFSVMLSAFSMSDAQTSESEPVMLADLSVTYVSKAGLEGYYSTSSYDGGAAGIATVNHATGNLTVTIPTISTSNRILSYVPTLFYHGYMKGGFFATALHSTPISPSPLALGFKLSAHESVITSGDNYVYMDADGTTHHFLPTSTNESGIFYDEDGLRLKMAVSLDRITITDTSNTIRTFEKLPTLNGWLLTEIQDAEGNALEYSYNTSTQLDKILFCPYGTTTKITELQFLYNDSGTMIAVYSLRTGDATLFRYSQTPTGSVSPTAREYLREVEYIVGGVSASALMSYYNNKAQNSGIIVKTNTLYTYNSDSSLYMAKESVTGRGLYFIYTSDNKVYAIGEVANNEEGATVFFEYGYGYTDVRTSGSDDIIDTNDDTITRYIFDENNRAVSIYNFHASTYEIYGATMGTYETQSNVKNNLKEQTVSGGSSVNYLLNSGFDIAGTNSLFAHWYTSTTGVYSAAADNGSPACACLYPKNNNDAFISQDVYLDVGTYTLSMQLDTREAEKYEFEIFVFPADQSEDPYIDEILPAKTSFSYGSNSFYSKEFTVSEGKCITVRITVTPNGTPISGVCIDNIMLEKSIGASDYSYVQVGGFEDTIGDQENNAHSAVQNFWQNQANGNVVLVEDYPFGKALRVQGTNTTAYAKTRVYEASADTLNSYDNDPYYFVSNSDIDFILSGYSKSTSSSSSTSAKFRMYAILTYYTGYGNAEITRQVEVSFLRGCETWQYASVYISGTPEEAEITSGFTESNYACLKSVDIYCDFSNQPTRATAYFDNISFINADNATHEEYKYSENGLLTEKSNRWYIDSYVYDTTGRVLRHYNSEGSAEIYSYDSNKTHRITKIVQYQRQKNYPDRYYPEIITEYSYHTTGLLTGEVVKSVTHTDSILFRDQIGTTLDAQGTEVPIYMSYYNYDDSESVNFVASYTTYHTNTNYYGAIAREHNGTNRGVYYHYTTDGRILATVNDYPGDGIVYSYDGKERLIGVFPATATASNGYATIQNAEEVHYTYDSANRLSTIATESTTYTFSYDVFGNNTGIEVGDTSLATYEYAENNGKLQKVTYGNGIIVEYVYDGVENLTEVWYTISGARTLAYEYEYTAKGQLVQIYDYLNDEGTNYRYNEAGQLIGEHTYDLAEDDFAFSNDYTYNDLGDITYAQASLKYTYNSAPALAVWNTSYSYDEKQRPFRITNSSGNYSLVMQNAYDDFGRLSSRTLTASKGSNPMIINTGLTYRTFGADNQTDALVSMYTSKITNTNGGISTTTYTYSYDEKNNITKIVYSTGKEIRYYYDDLSQLVREDNEIDNYTYTYTYDNAGNITAKKEYSLTAENVTPVNTILTYTYTYGNAEWGDQLTAYRGQSITYDTIGNPLSYYNGSRYTFTWTQGRRLASATLGTKTMTFAYNDAGLRTSKTVNGVTTEYYYRGSLLMAQKTGDEMLLFHYDENGSPLGFQYRNSTHASGVFEEYIYEKNLQGDIVAIYNNAGTKLLSYRYDAWGVVSRIYAYGGSGTNADKNPLRYRGYYYDTDLAMYYLQSRYYDPAIGRFINADWFASTNGNLSGNNMYVYCLNSPIAYKQKITCSTENPILVSSTVEYADRSFNSNMITQPTFNAAAQNSIHIFGSELRYSSDWDNGQMLSFYLGVIGFSSSLSYAKGTSGIFNVFAGVSEDAMNYFDKTYFAGIGINAFNVLGAELQVETLGLGVQINIGNFSVARNINLIGGTSLTFATNQDLGDGHTLTSGFTIEINTGCLFVAFAATYLLLTTGDITPILGY